MSPRTPHSPRGTTLIEAMIAMAVLLIGLTGYAALMPSVVRTNHFAKRISMASALATDLSENVARWPYNDARITPASLTTITGCAVNACLSDTTIAGTWDLGRADAPTHTPQFSDSGAQGLLLGLDIDGDATPEFERHWSVFEVQPTGYPVAIGKLVQIVVRWKEPTYGFRQITSSAFKPNPAAMTAQ